MAKPTDRFDAPLLFSLPPEETLDSANARCDRLQAEIDSLKEQAAKARAHVDALRVDAEIDRIATQRLAVIDKARTVLGRGYLPPSGTSSRAVQLAALARVDSQRYDAKSDAYIEARFDAEMQRAKDGEASFIALAKACIDPAPVKGKLDTALDAAAAEARTSALGGAPEGSKRLAN